jgi:hypothetical protein
VIFRGKFRGISCGNDFSKLFPRKILIFPIIFWGKIFRGIFPGKNVRKIGPWSPCLQPILKRARSTSEAGSLDEGTEVGLLG